MEFLLRNYRLVGAFGIFLFIAVAPFVSAERLTLQSSKTQYAVGETFTVSLSINTEGKAINTVSGYIDIPQDKVQILGTAYGNSIVTLWVERPAVDYGKGIIKFSGGIPGGFNGSNGPILSFTLKGRTTGAAVLTQNDIAVLLNDGLGTQSSSVQAPAYSLTIVPGEPKPEPREPDSEPRAPAVSPSDAVPPEAFIPMIARHPTVEENKYFVSFFAVDKGSGIARYEISEELFLVSRILGAPGWAESESPYVLKQQWWKSTVRVRAYDQAGNFSEGFAEKPFHPLVAWVAAGLAVLLWQFAPYVLKSRSRVRRKVV